MDELISREALVREVIGLTIVSPEVMNYANAVAVAIENAPIVDAEPVRRGRWVEQWDYDYMQYLHFCGECGKYPLTKEETMHDEVLSSYCPHCGAKMDKEK